MKLLKDLMKKGSKDMVLIALMLIYLLFNVSTPDMLSKLIDNIYGNLVIIIVALHIFMNTENKVVGVLVLLSAYELIRRASNDTGSAVMKYLPSENKKNCNMSSLNNFPVTLEEEMVNSMVPLVKHPASKDLDYKPMEEDTYDASDVHDNNLL